MKIILSCLQDARNNLWLVCHAIRNISNHNLSRELTLQFFTLMALQLLNSLTFSGVVSYTLSGLVFGIPYLPGITGCILRFFVPFLATVTILNYWYPTHRFGHWSWINTIDHVDDVIVPLVPIIMFFAFAFLQPFSIGGFIALLILHLFTTLLLYEASGRIGTKWVRHEHIQQFMHMVDSGVIVVKQDDVELSANEAVETLGLDQ